MAVELKIRCYLGVQSDVLARLLSPMHNATTLNHAAKNRAAALAVAIVRFPLSHLTLLPTFFTPMALRVGQVLRGLKEQYELLHPLKGSTVFKAKVLSSPIQ